MKRGCFIAIVLGYGIAPRESRMNIVDIFGQYQVFYQNDLGLQAVTQWGHEEESESFFVNLDPDIDLEVPLDQQVEVFEDGHFVLQLHGRPWGFVALKPAW